MSSFVSSFSLTLYFPESVHGAVRFSLRCFSRLASAPLCGCSVFGKFIHQLLGVGFLPPSTAAVSTHLPISTLAVLSTHNALLLSLRRKALACRSRFCITVISSGHSSTAMTPVAVHSLATQLLSPVLLIVCNGIACPNISFPTREVEWGSCPSRK